MSNVRVICKRYNVYGEFVEGFSMSPGFYSTEFIAMQANEGLISYNLALVLVALENEENQ